MHFDVLILNSSDPGSISFNPEGLGTTTMDLHEHCNRRCVLAWTGNQNTRSGRTRDTFTVKTGHLVGRVNKTHDHS